ncbi:MULTISPECIES: glycine zipper 2TM domain-containing protein [Achromobacter]|uniref:glycine zipper 2TM domain-containing protein n=1 Tax=Achromobacter TaxID=222 RepID=UPI00158301A9|nr:MULTISPECIES: glycine zipper 2TM domain-containing protein [Achromobacter]
MSSTLSVAALSIAFGICVGSLIWGAFALGSRLTVAVRARVDGIVIISQKTRRAAAVTTVVMAGLLAGCANQSASGGVYSYQQAQQVQQVQSGTVLSARPITIQASYNSGAGVAAGSTLGGLAGSFIGNHKGSYVAAALGALIGGIAGNSVERKVSQAAGIEVIVRLDSGQMQAVAQEADVPLKPGQRVNVLSGAGATRVVPI